MCSSRQLFPVGLNVQENAIKSELSLSMHCTLISSFSCHQKMEVDGATANGSASPLASNADPTGARPRPQHPVLSASLLSSLPLPPRRDELEVGLENVGSADWHRVVPSVSIPVLCVYSGGSVCTAGALELVMWTVGVVSWVGGQLVGELGR